MTFNSKKKLFKRQLLEFIDHSPTPFHTVSVMAELLETNGFNRLKEREVWNLCAGQRYFFTRNDSSIIAFILGRQPLWETGIRMVGAHTDSPCLKIKPQPELNRYGYFQLGVETYGGVLLNPWFDRDLSIAGRVTAKKNNGDITQCLIDFKSPIAVIPSLAIHLHRDANKNNPINQQQHLAPLLMQTLVADQIDFRQLLKRQLAAQLGASIDEVLGFELSLYDTQPSSLLGLNNEFIAAARLDNLLSCFVGLQSLLAADNEITAMLICNDHEEVGSASVCGAQGPMLMNALQRIVPNTEERLRSLDHSLLISADNAHGIHPNYADKHDGNHRPLLNGGPVIKVNANQRYATTDYTSAIFRDLCNKRQVPVQTFVTRSDMACGSTIGPITATQIGVKTLDVGVPTLAMHSIRELAGSEDAWQLSKVLTDFYTTALIQQV